MLFSPYKSCLATVFCNFPDTICINIYVSRFSYLFLPGIEPTRGALVVLQECGQPHISLCEHCLSFPSKERTEEKTIPMCIKINQYSLQTALFLLFGPHSFSNWSACGVVHLSRMQKEWSAAVSHVVYKVRAQSLKAVIARQVCRQKLARLYFRVRR